MKWMLSIASICFTICLQAQVKNELELAKQYHRSGDCEKVISIYESLDQAGINIASYYNNYLNCLLKESAFKKAEKLVKTLQNKYPKQPKYIADLGFVYKAMDKQHRAEKQFQKAIATLTPGKAHLVNSLANNFNIRNAPEWALKTYEKGQEVNPSYNFGFQLAYTYRNMGETEKMIDTYLGLVEQNPKNRQNVQNQLQNILGRTKGTEGNFDLLQQKLLKKVQKTNNVELTEMLVWLFMQKDAFDAAFIYSKALDKRLNEDGNRLYELATIAHENESYATAIKSYQYLITKGKNNPFYLPARVLEVIAQSEHILSGTYEKKTLSQLEKRYLETLEDIGRNSSTAYLLKEYAHLKGFYQHDTEAAIKLLNECITLSSGEPTLQAECKMELADLTLIQGEVWDAILLYGQVEKKFKEHPLGHEAKFRRARIAYYQGDFEWAQAQLNVLKASTTKLIANNAMDLSLLITDNMGLDTSSHAMQLYARAELLAFQNRFTESVQTLDSLSHQFAGHSLQDEVTFKKATIAKKQGDYKKAISLFEEVATSFAYDLLADDALFQCAKLTEEQLKDPEKALIFYEQILIDHSDSIYTAEARKRFRALRNN